MKKVAKKSPPKARSAAVPFDTASNHTVWVVLILLMCTFIGVTLASHFSFLYIFNNATQTNGLVTMGEAMLKGAVPYRDLFDPHGILLYGIYALASFIWTDSTMGVWLLEWTFLFASSFAVYKIARLYMSSLYALAAAMVGVFAITSTGFYGTGGSASAFGLPFMLWAMYVALSGFKYNHLGLRAAFMVGILGGIHYFIDPGSAGFYIAYVIAAMLAQLFKKKWLEALLEIIWFLMGAAIPTLGVIVYFIANSALSSLFELYFRLNWNTMLPMSFLERLQLAYSEIFKTVTGSYIVMGALAASILCVAYMRHVMAWIFVLLSFLGLGISIYFAGYITPTSFLPLAVYGVFGVILVFYLLYLLDTVLPAGKILVTILSFILAFGACGYLAYAGNQWQDIAKRRRDFAVLEFAKVIKETPEATLLNYGAPDQGLYVASGLVPELFYYQQSMNPTVFGENLENQNRYVEEAKPQFVLVTQEEGAKNGLAIEKALSEKYQEFGQITEENEGRTISYTLYKRK